MKFLPVQFYPASCLSVTDMFLSTLFLNTSVNVLPLVGDSQLMTKHKRRQESWGRLITKGRDGHLIGLDICWITATQRSNRILNDRRNGGRVSYINKAGQITESGLYIDKEMLYNARLYQQGDPWFTERIKSDCQFCLIIISIWSMLSYYHLLLSLITRLGFICFWLSRKLLSFTALFVIKNRKLT